MSGRLRLPIFARLYYCVFYQQKFCSETSIVSRIRLQNLPIGNYYCPPWINEREKIVLKTEEITWVSYPPQ